MGRRRPLQLRMSRVSCALFGGSRVQRIVREPVPCSEDPRSDYFFSTSLSLLPLRLGNLPLSLTTRCLLIRRRMLTGAVHAKRLCQGEALAIRRQKVVHFFSRPQATSHKPQATGHRPQATGHEPTT
eukprot:scaffold2373_cov239-Pinguiococcus_pyrenoidosus.AAC.2